jgi:hypothetical protein
MTRTTLVLFLFSFLFILGRCQMIPSFGVTTCSATEGCDSKLLVQVFLNQASNGNYQLNVNLPPSQLLTDSQGYKWQVTSPLAISVYEAK